MLRPNAQTMQYVLADDIFVIRDTKIHMLIHGRGAIRVSIVHCRIHVFRKAICAINISLIIPYCPLRGLNTLVSFKDLKTTVLFFIMSNIVKKPWGTYEIIKECDNSKVKHICVLPQNRLSLQSHLHRSEHWVIVKGSAWVRLGDIYYRLNVNDHIYIPAGEKHRIENSENTVLEFIETQCGSYLGEDDIIRYDDDYGRV